MKNVGGRRWNCKSETYRFKTMKIVLLLEGVVEVLPLLLLCLNVVSLLRFFFALLSVLVILGLWLGDLYGKVCYSIKRVYQEFEPFQVFLINFSFKASCISIICYGFEDDYGSQASLVLIGAWITFYVARNGYEGRSNNEKIVSSIYYAVTNIAFPSRCPMSAGTKSFTQVICVNMNWVLVYTVTVIVVMYHKGLPTLNIAFWSFDNFHYVNIIHKLIVLLLGPLSIYVMHIMESRSPDAVNFDAMNDFDKLRYVCMIEDRKNI